MDREKDQGKEAAEVDPGAVSARSEPTSPLGDDVFGDLDGNETVTRAGTLGEEKNDEDKGKEEESGPGAVSARSEPTTPLGDEVFGDLDGKETVTAAGTLTTAEEDTPNKGVDVTQNEEETSNKETTTFGDSGQTPAQINRENSSNVQPPPKLENTKESEQEIQRNTELKKEEAESELEKQTQDSEAPSRPLWETKEGDTVVESKCVPDDAEFLHLDLSGAGQASFHSSFEIVENPTDTTQTETGDPKENSEGTTTGWSTSTEDETDTTGTVTTAIQSTETNATSETEEPDNEEIQNPENPTNEGKNENPEYPDS